MLSLHALFGDHAVVPCEVPFPFGGHADPGAEVTVRFAGRRVVTRAAADGRWTATWPALPPGGPFDLVVESDSGTLCRTDLLVGELWLCAGQSNMEWTFAMLQVPPEEIPSADDAGLRCFSVPRSAADRPSEALDGRWFVPDCARSPHLPALAWHFARGLRRALGRPVGVVVAAVGGTSIGLWLPRALLAARPDYRELCPADAPLAERFNPHDFLTRAAFTAGWESPAADESAWTTLAVPGTWQEQGWAHNGAVWYRRAVELPTPWRGQPLRLEFGGCDDFDETFVNGTSIGATGPDLPGAYSLRRSYAIPAALTAEGRLVVAVRVFDHWGNGGITGFARLVAAGSGETLDLCGRWRARVELTLPWRTDRNGAAPGGLYHGMIHPLGLGTFRGVLWYQGESDLARAARYRQLLGDLIASWRERFRSPALPFAVVQLPNFQLRGAAPAESDWAELREAQRLAAADSPDVGLVVSIDLGDPRNLHPRDKRPLAARLVRWALSRVYGRDEIPVGGPVPIELCREGAALVVRFDSVGAGLRLRPEVNEPAFQLCGVDGCWSWAEAETVGPATLRVHASAVAAPLRVRYAWQDNPPSPLGNAAGFPATPFQSDVNALLSSH